MNYVRRRKTPDNNNKRTLFPNPPARNSVLENFLTNDSKGVAVHRAAFPRRVHDAIHQHPPSSIGRLSNALSNAIQTPT